MQSGCLSCALVTGSVIIVAMSIAAAILFGMYIENEKKVFKDMMERRCDEKKELLDYVKLQKDYHECLKQHEWNEQRKKVYEECQLHAKCSIEELVECRKRLNEVKTSVSEFVEDEENQCVGVWCNVIKTVAGVVSDATKSS